MNINSTTYSPYSPRNAYLGANSTNPSADSNQIAKTQNPSNPQSASGATSNGNQDPLKPENPHSEPGQQASEEQTAEKQTTENQTAGKDQFLTPAELQLVTELKQTDTEVRTHEMAHIAAGGSLITSGASFTYKRGPDGNNYAVGGEVGIDTSAIPGDPQATLQKMQRVKRSALAPASPSGQDRKVASQATAMATKASSDLTKLMAEEQAASNESKAFGKKKLASDSYIKVNNLPEESTSTFDLAV